MGITINAQKTRPARESIDMEKVLRIPDRALLISNQPRSHTGKHVIIVPVCTLREMDTRSIFPDSSHPHAIPTVSSR